MKTSFMTFLLPGYTLEQLVTFAARAPYDGIELRVDSGHQHSISSKSTPAERHAAKALFTDHGVAVACIATSECMNMPDPAKQREMIDAAKANIDLAADLGAPVVRIFAGGHGGPLTPEVADRVAAAYDELGAYAQPLGVTPMLETGHDIMVGRDEIALALPRIKAPNFGALWNYSEIDDDTLKLLAPRLRHFHVHDEILEPGNDNILKLARRLKPLNYTGYFSLEVIKFQNIPEDIMIETAQRLKSQLSQI